MIKEFKALYEEVRVIKERKAKLIEEAIIKLEDKKEANATELEWEVV